MNDIKETILEWREQQLELFKQEPTKGYQYFAQLAGMTYKQYETLMNVATSIFTTKID